MSETDRNTGRRASSGELDEELGRVDLALPYRQAFVVPFRADRAGTGERLAGRVEHVASGRSRCFGGPGELEEFFRSALAELRQAA